MKKKCSDNQLDSKRRQQQPSIIIVTEVWTVLFTHYFIISLGPYCFPSQAAAAEGLQYPRYTGEGCCLATGNRGETRSGSAVTPTKGREVTARRRSPQSYLSSRSVKDTIIFKHGEVFTYFVIKFYAIISNDDAVHDETSLFPPSP